MALTKSYCKEAVGMATGLPKFARNYHFNTTISLPSGSR